MIALPSRFRSAVLTVVVSAAAVATVVPAAATATAPRAAAARTVTEHRVIGHSVLGRPIIAYRLGDPHAKTVSVIIGQMHGDEPAGVTIASALINGTQVIKGVGVWVIATMNPDGNARHTRQNAHGVDLNRNFPTNWARLSGQYYSGPKPLSEPESRAVYRFLKLVHPRFVVSLHQPLDGVDTTAGSGPAYRAFRLALGRNLGLPQKALRCWSVCHGNLSAWFHAAHLGVAVETVEFGWHPARSYLLRRARHGIVSALGGRLVNKR